MIVYVDLEHPRLAEVDARAWERTLMRRLKVKYFLEDVTGDDCLLVRYHQFGPALVDRLGIRAVVVSGNTTDFEHYRQEDLAGLRTVFRAAPLPILAFCGGFQLMAEAYGAPIGPMGAWQPGDPRPMGGFDVSPGNRQETGFQAVRVRPGDPMFAGLPGEISVFQAHYWEVKEVPAGFEAMAESALCQIQALRSKSAPLFGTQFHPEEFDTEHPHGSEIIRNFFRWVAV